MPGNPELFYWLLAPTYYERAPCCVYDCNMIANAQQPLLSIQGFHFSFMRIRWLHNNSAVQAELTFVQYLIKSLKLSPGSQAKECIHFAISYLFKSNHIVFLKTNDINKPPSISFPIKQGKSNKLNKFFKFYFSLEFYPLFRSQLYAFEDENTFEDKIQFWWCFEGEGQG